MRNWARELGGEALLRALKAATLMMVVLGSLAGVIEFLSGSGPTVVLLHGLIVLIALGALVAFQYLPVSRMWTVIQVTSVGITACISAAAVVSPEASVVRLASLAAPPAIAAAVAPNDRRLPFLLGVIVAAAGATHLARSGHELIGIGHWLMVITAVTVFSHFGAARYLRQWIEFQASIRALTLSLTEAASGLVLLADEEEILASVHQVLRAQGFAATFERTDAPASPVAPGLITVPIVVEGQQLGLMRIEGTSLNEAVEGTLELFARHVGTAIANAHHHRRAVARLEELRGLQRSLVERERLAMLGEAAAMVAHEVRNPLGAILNATALLKTPVGEPLHQDLLRMIEQESGRLDELVHDLLFLGRPLEPSISPVNLPELCEHVAQQVRTQPAFANVSLNLRSAANLPLVQGDAGHLQILIENLLRNAAQASPPRGTVHLELQGTGNGVRLMVDDEGEGIPDEMLEKIFQPFFTTRLAGTGLGLTLVKRIADAHALQVKVSRNAMQGSRFELDFR